MMAKRSHSKLICGIDIGAKGCLALIELSDKIILKEVIKYDLIKYYELLKKIKVDLMVIERVHAKFGNSASSMFSFGERSGEIIALTQLVHHQHKNIEVIEWVSPQAWQKAIGCQKTESKEVKQLTAEYVEKVFEKDYRLYNKLKNLDFNKTDAIGIALYGARQLGLFDF